MSKETSALLTFYLCLLALLILIFLNGCNPVKQVLKSPEKTNKVVWAWMQDNPFRNDTTFIKGKDSLRIDTLITNDSVYVECQDPVTKQPIKVKCPPTKIITKERFRTDTLRWEDLGKLNILKADISLKTGQITQLKEDKKAERQRANKFLWLIITLCGLIGVGIILKIKRII